MDEDASRRSSDASSPEGTTPEGGAPAGVPDADVTPNDSDSETGLDRRRFIGRGALGVAGAALAGRSALGGDDAGVAASVGDAAQRAEDRASATEGGARAWGDRPRGWWRHEQEVEHPPEDDAAYDRELDLDIQITRHEIVPGYEFHALAFNGEVPGPEIRLREGEWVKVNFTNRTELLHTIHWHGVDLQYEQDGVPYITQDPVMPDSTFTYRFRAVPGGTRWYHCHFGTKLHMNHAMHGPLIIEPEKDPIKEEFGYSRDYTMMLSSFDTNFSREEMNFMLERMKQRIWLMKNGGVDERTLAVFENREKFLEAVEDGWDPPYLPNRNQGGGGAELDHNFFAINGKAYPMTDPVMIREGETIRIRLVNGGVLEHYMHLHGHQFWKVADDGNLMEAPVKMNTVRVSPGKTADIVVEGYNPGYWTFHDHNTSRATNNGMYPGGILTELVYEEMADYDGYKPKIALDE